ncbi:MULTISPECIES: hypothetical protein [Nocardia]|uniref:hypothetical protein n=1 Tax=Nocardia TaxID=1817 RepID=UPI0024584705|nr:MULTISPECIES: hypothetical protein [Nocardia]
MTDRHPSAPDGAGPGELPPLLLIVDSDSQANFVGDEMWYMASSPVDRHSDDSPAAGTPGADWARKVVSQRAADLPPIGRDRDAYFPRLRTAKDDPA